MSQRVPLASPTRRRGRFRRYCFRLFSLLVLGEGGIGSSERIGEDMAAGVAEILRVGVEQDWPCRGPYNDPGEAGLRERGASLADEDEWRRFALPLESTQGSQLITLERMSAGVPFLTRRT